MMVYKSLKVVSIYDKDRYTPQGARAGREFNKLLQEVRHCQGGWGHFLDHPPIFGQITEFWFLKKINFFDFGGSLKTFLTPKDLICP